MSNWQWYKQKLHDARAESGPCQTTHSTRNDKAEEKAEAKHVETIWCVNKNRTKNITYRVSRDVCGCTDSFLRFVSFICGCFIIIFAFYLRLWFWLLLLLYPFVYINIHLWMWWRWWWLYGGGYPWWVVVAAQRIRIVCAFRNSFAYLSTHTNRLPLPSLRLAFSLPISALQIA